MTKEKFEDILGRCCAMLSEEARGEQFKSAAQFENRVRGVLYELTKDDSSFEIDFSPHPQAFPDIAMGEFGVDVKFTLGDTWRSITNSVLETQRVEGVRHIYIVFGKMGGVPEVRWGEYERCVVHVRTSHVPRFEVEIPLGATDAKDSLPFYICLPITECCAIRRGTCSPQGAWQIRRTTTMAVYISRGRCN